jgi:uncharacterized protein with NAD-binding domain and iron-sulfur cluster
MEKSIKMPKKIAVIGGGLAAITSVYNLLKDPDWKEKYDITIYQMGWRLGGKGASGVNPEVGYRIEEHGLHLWMGFYENAFAMMREVYKELDRKPGQALATFDEAYKGQPFMIFEENVRGKWVDWQINFPTMAGQSGDGKPVTWEDLLINIERFLFKDNDDYKHLPEKKRTFWSWLFPDKGHKKVVPSFFHQVSDEIEKGVVGTIENIAKKLLKVMFKLLVDIEKFESHEHHITMLQNFRKWLWDMIGELLEENHLLRRLWINTDLMIALLTGMLRDGVVKFDNGVKLDFTVINDYDYAEWLIKHGADKELSIPSPLVKSMYDGPFAFKNGDITQGNAEAGTMLNIFLRLAFTCKEHVVWRMQAGMGDTVFAPVYQLLKKEQKAKIKFFYKAVDMQLSADKKTVERIVMHKQVKLNGKDNNNTDNYNPLITVNDLDCWPSHPLYEQLDPEQAKLLIKNDINLESSWSKWEYYEEKVLTKGIDFDEIIIGASLASLPHFASQLVDENTAWQQMLANVGTVQTQAFQFWLNKDSKSLDIEEDKLLSCYVEPLDTFSAMNQLLVREKWPNNEAKFISYVCGAFPDSNNILPYTDHSFPQQENDRVKQNMLDYFKNNLQHVIPAAFDSKGNFDWTLLVDLENKQGEDRLNSQYFRANIDSSERYVLSLKGSSKYRLKTDESGFENLYLTGDWIQNQMNAGFVEGAVVSGLLTARAVSGNKELSIFMPNWDLNKL